MSVSPRKPEFKRERTGPRGRALRAQVREDEHAKAVDSFRQGHDLDELDELDLELARWAKSLERKGYDK